MEHRLCERQPLGLEVVLKRTGKPELITKAQDIAQDGMFVCVERGFLRKGETLDVEFFLKEDSGFMHYCKKVWVVHCNDAGVGLMFITPPVENKES